MSDAATAAKASTDPEREATINALFDEVRIPGAVKAAAAAIAGEGLVVALLGLQNLTLVHWLGALVLVPIGLVAIGTAGIAVGAQLVRGRRWTLKAALVLAPLLTLGSLGFLVLGLFAGVYSLFSLLGFGGGIAALVLSILAARPFTRLMATRQKLREAGFELDL